MLYYFRWINFIIAAGWQFNMAEVKLLGDLSPISLDPFVNQLILLLLFPEDHPILDRKEDK